MSLPARRSEHGSPLNAPPFARCPLLAAEVAELAEGNAAAEEHMRRELAPTLAALEDEERRMRVEFDAIAAELAAAFEARCAEVAARVGAPWPNGGEGDG